MFSTLLTTIAEIITGIVSGTGYLGVFLLMLIESAGIPAPSEVIMPFAGYLVTQGRFAFWPVVAFGALGNVAGSLVAYAIADFGGRPFLHKYGKYILFSEHDLALAERFFAKYGVATVFLSRLLPVIRTYISFPAGLARMPLVPFIIYSFVGSLIWSIFLAYLGIRVGADWVELRERFHGIDTVIGVLLVAGVVWWIWRHLHRRSL